jgi:hypothetical protein
MKRTKQINMAVSPEELTAIKEAAAEAGLDLSAWARLVLRYSAGMGTLGEQVKRAKRASPWELQS